MIIRDAISTNKVYRIQRLLYCILYLYHVITIKVHFYILKGKIIRFNVFFKFLGSGEHLVAMSVKLTKVNPLFIFRDAR